MFCFIFVHYYLSLSIQVIDSIPLSYLSVKNIEFYRNCTFTVLDGVTIRGCSPAQTVESTKEDPYETCKTDKCNGDIFPEDRLHCLHCAGSSCVNQANTFDVRYPCVNYDGNDKCYSVFSFGKLF